MMLLVLGAWLLADFISGVFHWAQDRLLTSPCRIRFIDAVRTDNDLHHKKPTVMLLNSWWGNINTTAVIAWPVAGVLYALGAPRVLWLAVFFVSFANLVHRFAHESRPLFPIRCLQAVGAFSSHRHHREHHFGYRGLILKEKSISRFCGMTCWLNPILELVGFFRLLDIVFRLDGVE